MSASAGRFSRRPTIPLLLALALAAACLATAAHAAQAPKPADPANPFGRKYPPRIYDAQRLQGKPPTIDGHLDDEAWKQGEWSGNYTQQAPTEGAPPTMPTELKILYDDKYLYFAIRAHDD